MLAIREDPLRTELLGYDIRARQLVVFVLAAVLAGISGLLYVQWGNYITPSQVGLLQAALPVIWVAVGGRDSLLAVAHLDLRAELAQLSLCPRPATSMRWSSSARCWCCVMLFFPSGIIVTLARELPRRGWRAAFGPRARR